MKNITLLLAAIIFLAFGCDEIKPEINPIVDQGECPVAEKSLVLNQGRQVIIEEFTGVRCVNCPAGSEAIEDLIGIHGSKLIAISIHSGFFSPPYPESLYDFTTEDGDNILSFLGEPLGFPTAVVNRKQFPNESSLQVGRNSWANYIAEELAIPPKVKLHINKTYNSDSRELDIEVSVFVEEAISEDDVRISVGITEDDIVDWQLTPGGRISDYNHKHVFREMITNHDGNPLTEELILDAKFCKSYSTTLKDEWNADHCHIFALIHIGGTSKEVLQAVQTDLK